MKKWRLPLYILICVACLAAFAAAGLAIQNLLGLVCDPIAGLVEAPCQARNAAGASNALVSAELVLAGVPEVIPFDEVVEAAREVGHALPESLRETALGGIAATPTARRLAEKTGCGGCHDKIMAVLSERLSG